MTDFVIEYLMDVILLFGVFYIAYFTLRVMDIKKYPSTLISAILTYIGIPFIVKYFNTPFYKIASKYGVSYYLGMTVLTILTVLLIWAGGSKEEK